MGRSYDRSYWCNKWPCRSYWGKFRALISKVSNDGLPFDPLVWISLTSHGTKDGNVIISESLASAGEIDGAIDRLIRNLETTRKRSKKKIKVPKG